MTNDSDPFPATFPLNLDPKKGRKRSKTTNSRSDGEEDAEESTEMSILRDIQRKLVNLTTVVNELTTKVDTHISNCPSDNSVKTLKDQIQSTQEALLNIDNSQYEEDKKRKFRCIPKWGELHRKRRDSYFKYFSFTQVADIMENYINAENPYIMRAYRPKYSPGEKAERYKLRENHAISSMMVDVNQKRITAREQYDIYSEVDQEITNLLDRVDDDDDKQFLKDLWAKEIDAAEEKSRSFFNQKKKPWWDSLPTKYPYNGQQSEPIQNDTARESENSNPVGITNEVTNNANIDEDEQMEVESSTEPWTHVTYRRGGNPSLKRTVRQNVRTQDKIQNNSTPKPSRHQVEDQSSSRNRGGYRGSNTAQNSDNESSRGRGTSRGRGDTAQNSSSTTNGSYRGRGTFRGRGDHSRSRGRSRGRGNYRRMDFH